MGEFPSGQRGQTVNLLAVLSVVRIHLPPLFYLLSRGRAVRKLVGLITRRSQVQILSPLLNEECLVQAGFTDGLKPENHKAERFDYTKPTHIAILRSQSLICLCKSNHSFENARVKASFQTGTFKRLLYAIKSYAQVAQLVEQLICNQQVGGSSPSTSSRNG